VAEAVGVTLPVEDGLPAAEYVRLAQLAERSGYDAVQAGEVAEMVDTARYRMQAGLRSPSTRRSCHCARCSFASRP